MQRNAKICEKMVLSMKVFSDFWFDHRKYRFWYLLVPRKCEKCVFFILFWMLKWSNGVGENEIIIIWCLSTTYNVKTCQKFNEIAEMTKSWKFSGLLHCGGEGGSIKVADYLVNFHKIHPFWWVRSTYKTDCWTEFLGGTKRCPEKVLTWDGGGGLLRRRRGVARQYVLSARRLRLSVHGPRPYV